MVVYLSKIKETLIEIITKSFLKVKKKRIVNKQRSRFFLNSFLINSSIRKIKEDKPKKAKKEKELEEECEGITSVDKNDQVNGGYGTVNKHYGATPVTKYVDYNKLWGHLGSYRTYGTYGNVESANDIAMKNGESSREMVSTETLEKAARHFKYFMVGDVMGDVGFVPPFGSKINSKEWEKYRLMNMMSIYKPLIALKRASA